VVDVGDVGCGVSVSVVCGVGGVGGVGDGGVCGTADVDGGVGVCVISGIDGAGVTGINYGVVVVVDVEVVAGGICG